MDPYLRRRHEEAFYDAQEIARKVRRPRKATIRNDLFSLLIVCPCGRPSLRSGEVEYAVMGGYCENCARPLAHVIVITRRHARDLAELAPTIASQQQAANKEPNSLAPVLVLPVGGGRARSELQAIQEYFDSHPDTYLQVLARARELEGSLG
jgi:hypothetical protein